MNALLDRINLFFMAIPEAALRRRWAVWGLFLLALGAAAPGVMRFELDLTNEAFLERDDPMQRATDRFKLLFGGEHSLYIVYEAKDGDVFSQKSLEAVRSITRDLEDFRPHLKPGTVSPLEHIADVTTIINARVLEPRQDGMVSRQFFGNHLPLSSAERERARRQALENPVLRKQFVSEDSRFGGILIRTDFGTTLVGSGGGGGSVGFAAPGAAPELSGFKITAGGTASSEEQAEFVVENPLEYAAFVNAVEAILQKPENSSTLAFHTTGMPVFARLMVEQFGPQISVTLTISLVLVIFTLLLLFRSPSAVLWPVVIVVTAAVMTVGVLGWLGLKMNLMIGVTILLTLVVGVADSVHILSGYLFFRNEGLPHFEALKAVYRKSGLAVFVTSATTAAGMLTLVAVPLVPIRVFGFSAALSVLFAFLITVFMLPVMVDWWRPATRLAAKKGVVSGRGRHPVQWVLRKVERMGMAWPRSIMLVFLLATGLLLFGASQVVVDSNLLTIFKKGQPIRVAMETADREMGAGRNLSVMVNAQQVDGLKDPRLLRKMEAFQRYLENEHPDKVTRTHSLADIAKDSLRTLNGGSEAWHRVPENPELLAQVLFLFNNANSKDRRAVVTDDYSMARISVGLRMASTNGYAEFFRQTEEAMARMFDPLKQWFPGLQVSLVGDLPFETRVVSLISKAQVRGFALAVGVISILLLFLFGSVRVGLLAVLPNLFPMIAVFGLMGFLGIPLDSDTMLVVPVTIGIVVDDTIHFLTHFRVELAQRGSTHQAIAATFREAGQAIVFTSVILTFSFLSMAWLDHQGLSAFGYLGAIAILTALASDLLFLPALLKAFQGKLGMEQVTPAEPENSPAQAY